MFLKSVSDIFTIDSPQLD